LKITALGTGTSQGIPHIGCHCQVCHSQDPMDKRLRSSILVESTQTKVLIDIGPDFRTQFLANNLSTIDALLITHEHNDHIIGLDDIRAINQAQNKVIPLYANARVNQILRHRFEYIFSSKPYSSAPKLQLIDVQEQSFLVGDISVEPIKVVHGNLQIMGYRMNEMAYITDGSYIISEEKEKLKDLKVLIINALRHKKHPTHFSLEEALDLIDELKPTKAYLTHISHRMGKTAEWSKVLPENVSPLNDMMKIDI